MRLTVISHLGRGVAVHLDGLFLPRLPPTLGSDISGRTDRDGRGFFKYPKITSSTGCDAAGARANGVKVFYGILGIFGTIGVLLSLIVIWISMAPTSDYFYERDMRIARSLDELRVKRLKADRDSKLKELDTARMLDIERDARGDAIVRDFKEKVGSGTRAQDETRRKNKEDRQQTLIVAAFGLLASLLVTALSVQKLRAQRHANHN